MEVATRSSHSVLPATRGLCGVAGCGKEQRNMMLQRFANPRRAGIQQRVRLFMADPTSVDNDIIGVLDMQIARIARGLKYLSMQRHITTYEVNIHAVQHLRPIVDDDRCLFNDLALECLKDLLTRVDDPAWSAPIE
jgi:hypothetical protein